MVFVPEAEKSMSLLVSRLGLTTNAGTKMERKGEFCVLFFQAQDLDGQADPMVELFFPFLANRIESKAMKRSYWSRS